jgi:hypothetical protein
MLVAPGAAQAAGPSISLAWQSGGTYKYDLNTPTNPPSVAWKDFGEDAIVLSALSGVTGASLSGDLASQCSFVGN